MNKLINEVLVEKFKFEFNVKWALWKLIKLNVFHQF